MVTVPVIGSMVSIDAANRILNGGNNVIEAIQKKDIPAAITRLQRNIAANGLIVALELGGYMLGRKALGRSYFKLGPVRITL